MIEVKFTRSICWQEYIAAKQGGVQALWHCKSVCVCHVQACPSASLSPPNVYDVPSFSSPSF